jgi:hypothetical protein
MFTTQDILKLLLLISPIILIQVGMAVYALIDLSRRAKTRGPRWAWTLGLILSIFSLPAGIIVSGIYLAWGRHAEV